MERNAMAKKKVWRKINEMKLHLIVEPQHTRTPLLNPHNRSNMLDIRAESLEQEILTNSMVQDIWQVDTQLSP
jgi:hypothetical protein